MNFKTKITIILFFGFLLLIIPLYLGIKNIKETSNILDFIEYKQLALSKISMQLDNDIKQNHTDILRAILLQDIYDITISKNIFSQISSDMKRLNDFIKVHIIDNDRINNIIVTINKRFIAYQAVNASIYNALKNKNKEDIQDALIGYDSVIKHFTQDIEDLTSAVNNELIFKIKEIKEVNEKTKFWVIFSIFSSILLIGFSIQRLFNINEKMLKELNRAEEAKQESKELQKQLLKYNDDLEQEIIRKSEELHTKIYTSFLSNLPNRNKLLSDLKEYNFTKVAIVDIDKFQRVNDVYGEDVGNIAINKSADFIVDTLKDRRYNLYHTSGDEFVIAVDKEYDIDNELFVQDIDRLLEKYKNNEFVYDAQTLNLTMSAGISFYGHEKIISYADMALKDAKSKNIPFVIFDEDKQLENDYKAMIECHAKLVKAFENGGIISYFQPIIPILDEIKDTKYESLVRIVDNDKVIPPFQFIDVAKKNKLYERLTKKVLDNTLRVVEKHKIPVSINISMDDISNKNTQEYLFSRFDKFAYNYLITVELLETEDFLDYNTVESFCKKIRSYGITIALDDFGSGYSNFSHILNLPIDFIKIDSSLIANIDRDTNAQIMVETIVNLAKRLNIQTIAEFVASEEVLKKIKEIGVDYAQGFYTGKPEPIEKYLL